MNTRRIGFIGGGRITRIFLDGWNRANALPANIVVSDCNADTLARLKARFPAINTVQGSGAAASQDLVFLAVHPPVMAEVASAIKGSLKPEALAGGNGAASRRDVSDAAAGPLPEDQTLTRHKPQIGSEHENVITDHSHHHRCLLGGGYLGG